jgi:hypothetical protein
MSMSWGIFTDRNYKPTIEEVFIALASSKAGYERLVSFAERTFRVHGEFKFYGKNYGWAFRFNKSGRALIALYPGKAEFTAQIILNREQALVALNSDISATLKDIIANTPEIQKESGFLLELIQKVSAKILKS